MPSLATRPPGLPSIPAPAPAPLVFSAAAFCPLPTGPGGEPPEMSKERFFGRMRAYLLNAGILRPNKSSERRSGRGRAGRGGAGRGGAGRGGAGELASLLLLSGTA